MFKYHLAAVLNAALCVGIYYVPRQALLLVLFPTVVTSALALWFILGVSPWLPYLDHRGKEHDWTPRTIQVVVEGCPPGCPCAESMARTQSISGVIRVSPTRVPSRQFDFCLFLGCGQTARVEPGAFHDLTNLALANPGIAFITLATPWDWRPAVETLWGRVQYIPKQGTMFCLRHPAVARILHGGRELVRGKDAGSILAHSRQTLGVEDWRIYSYWGVRPPTHVLEIYELATMPTRLFAFVFTILVNRGDLWVFLIYGPIVLAHLIRFVRYVLNNPNERCFHHSGSFPQTPQEEVNERPCFTHHGHHFAS